MKMTLQNDEIMHFHTKIRFDTEPNANFEVAYRINCLSPF